METQEHKSEVIGSLDLWVDTSRFDQTEMIVVGDKQFIRRDKVLSMLQQWDDLNKPARAEQLKTHAVEFGEWIKKNNYCPNTDTGKWYDMKGSFDDDTEYTELELYHLFNPKI